MPPDENTPQDPSLEEQLTKDLAAATDLPGSDPGDTTGEAPSSTPEPATPSWREQASQFGVDLSAYESDEDAFKHLSDLNAKAAEAEQLRGQHEQLSELAKYGKEYVQHAADFQQYLQTKQQQQEPSDPYAAPEFSEAWLGMVTRNDDGEIVPIPRNGGTPEIAQKVARHLQWQQQFLTNPYRHLEGFVEKRAKEIAESLLDTKVTDLTNQIAGQQFIATNRDWLFAGTSPTGQPQLSEEGKVFTQFLQEYNADNLPPQLQQKYAMRDMAKWREAKGTASQAANQAAAPAQKKEQFLTAAASRTANESASENTPPGTPQNANMTFQEMLAAEMKKAGITEEDIIAA